MMAIILTSIFNFLIGSFPDDFCAWKPRYDGQSDILPDARRQCSGSRIEEQPASIYIEMACIFAFTGEYVGRLLTCGVVMPVGRFICSPMNVLDLVAIAPWYITELVVFVTHGEGGVGQFFSIVRLVRLARILRIFKASKSLKLMQVLGRTLKRSAPALATLLLLVFVLMLFFGAIIATVEGGKYNRFMRAYLRDSGLSTPYMSIPQAMYYCMTSMTTVGYGDLFPETPLGQLTGICTILLGIVALSLPITLIGSTFREEYDEIQRVEERERRLKLMREQETVNEQAASGEMPKPPDSFVRNKLVRSLAFLSLRGRALSPQPRSSQEWKRRSIPGLAEAEWLIEDYKLSARADIKDTVLRSELDLLRLARRTIIQSRVCTKRKPQAAKLETACSAFGAVTAMTLFSKAGADASARGSSRDAVTELSHGTGDSNATRRADVTVTDIDDKDDARLAPPPEVSVPIGGVAGSSSSSSSRNAANGAGAEGGSSAVGGGAGAVASANEPRSLLYDLDDLDISDGARDLAAGSDLKQPPKPPPLPAPTTAPVQPPAHHVRPSKIDLDEGPDAPPIQLQIAAALRQNAGKVLDLFRAWDANGDGEVSKKEFRKAMPTIGLDVPVQEVDALFDSWDQDGGGVLHYKELSKVLKSPAPPPTSVKQAPVSDPGRAPKRDPRAGGIRGPDG